MVVKNLNHNTSPFYTGRVAAMYDMKGQTDAYKQPANDPISWSRHWRQVNTTWIYQYNLLTKVFQLHLTYFHNEHIY